MKTTLIAAATLGAVLLGSTASYAQDAAAKAFNWTGPYAGVVLGAGTTQQTTPNYYYGDGYGSTTDTGHGGTLGATLGYNAQEGNFVYGVEADYSTSSLGIDPYDAYYYNGYYGHVGEWNNLATLRLRAGLALDTTLVYMTAGLASADVNQKYCYSGVDGSNCDSSDYDSAVSGRQSGYAFGAGVEHAFTDKISLKAEYLYVGIPDHHNETGYNAENDYNNQSWSSSANMVRVGLNFRF
jgi:outer membrane immunogenic protein